MNFGGGREQCALELQKGSPVLHAPFRVFPSTASVSSVNSYTDNISHWSTVVFTFLLFSVFSLGISTLSAIKMMSIVSLVPFYFIRKQTVK